MLIVNVINTLPNIEDRKMKTSMNFLSEIDDRKERKKRNYFFFKTNVLVPNKQNVRRWRYRSGYTYLQPAGCLIIRPDRQRSTTMSQTVGKGHKILKMSY